MSDSPVTDKDREEMDRMVREILCDESRARVWWVTPNPSLGGLSPVCMMAASAESERMLRSFIFDAYENRMSMMA